MIAALCNGINANIERDYFDKKHGLVFAATASKNGSDVTFPIDYASKDANFEKAVIPDEKIRALSYFESNGATRVISDGAEYTGFLSMVIWVNTSKIDHENNAVADLIAVDMERAIRKLNGVMFDGGKIRRTRVNYIHNRNQNIFNRYTYAEKTKWLQPPYDAVKIDFEIDFTVTCVDIALNPKQC